MKDVFTILTGYEYNTSVISCVLRNSRWPTLFKRKTCDSCNKEDTSSLTICQWVQVAHIIGVQLVCRSEEEFYKLRPANKTDHLCQSWQYCHMFMKFRQSIT